MANLLHNERVKLRAMLFNAAAGACFTVGVAAPIAAGVFYGVGGTVSLRALAVGAIFWLGAVAGLHGLAYRAPKGLRDD